MRPYTAKTAKYYDLILDSEVKRAPKEVKFFKKVWGKKVKRVLDAACGTGRLSIPLAKAGYKVVGIDITQEMLKIARSKKQEKNPKFIKADMRTWKSKNKFDAIVCGSNTLTHLITEKDVSKCFDSFRKNLKKNGVLIFDVWNVENWGSGYKAKTSVMKGDIKVKNIEQCRIDKKKKYHYWKHNAVVLDHGKKIKLSFGGRLRYRLKNEWKELLEKSGFKDVEIIIGKIYKNKIYFIAKK